MQVDTIKVIFTYIIATLVIVGGGAMLYFSRLDPADSGSSQLQLVIAGFMGAAITWVFSSESSTRATRAAQSSTAAGAALNTPGTSG